MSVYRTIGPLVLFSSGVIECKEPLSCVSHKMSIYRTDSRGKESSTTFERLSYNGKTSVVKCKLGHIGIVYVICPSKL